jgi:hypothetical protein
MPSPERVLTELAALASLARGLALLWHLAMLLVLWALWTGRWRPSRRLAAMLSAAPVATAAILAAAVKNPFNAAVLGLTAVALLAFGARLSTRRVEWSAPWAASLGAAAVAYALVYPHFIPGGLELAVFLAPVGVIPCPSLALVLGLGLLGDGFGSKAWSAVAVVVGLFYALFGILRLGVWLDVGLLVAAISLAVLKLAPRLRPHGTPHPAT